MLDASNKRPRVLIVDDHLPMAETLADGLADSGYDTVALSSGREAARRLRQEPFDALITDLRMPEVDGLELLKLSHATDPTRPVIVMTAYSAVESAIDSVRQGAFHYLTKPFKLDELELFLKRGLEDSQLRREAVALRDSVRAQQGLASIVGSSKVIRNLCELVRRLSSTHSPVLVSGETGTGKELIARAIHAQGPRALRPFVPLDCTTTADGMLQRELFARLQGTPAEAGNEGSELFSDLVGGTLFLDGIGELSQPLQVQLLGVLEGASVRRANGAEQRSFEVRVVMAQHRGLKDSVRHGRFSDELLHRAGVVSIEIPPLRQRREDIPALLEHFIRRARERHPHSEVFGFSKDATERLLDYHWPGNVRELERLVERMVIVGRTGEIQAEELPTTISQHAHTSFTP